MTDRTNVFLITGFLGSGKTTFLNRIIQDFPRDKKLMILMNEFGELDVDGTLVQDEDIDLLEISKGSIFCVCVKTDFIKGLQKIAKDIQPDVLLIESTGVANPTDLKRDLTLPFFNNRFNLAEQFCVIDAVHFEEEYEVFSSVEKQIASSTVFIINKVDVATAEQVRQVKDLVARHHPAPVFFETTYADFPFQKFFFRGQEAPVQAGEEPRGRYLTSQELEEAIERMLVDPNREITPPDRLLSAIYSWKGGKLEEFKSLVGRLPKALVRSKGFVSEDGITIYLFSWVMGRWTLEETPLPPDRVRLLNRVVFIGPPEVMPQLAAISEQVSSFSPESQRDPMEGRV
jgi:G3E family GTPase